jgi:hypothetical protein
VLATDTQADPFYTEVFRPPLEGFGVIGGRGDDPRSRFINGDAVSPSGGGALREAG